MVMHCQEVSQAQHLLQPENAGCSAVAAVAQLAAQPCKNERAYATMTHNVQSKYIRITNMPA